MITDIIVGGFLGLIRILTDLIPPVPIPPPQGSGSFLATLGSFNAIIPLNQIIIVFLAAIAIRLILVGFDAIAWIYHQFWGSS